MKRKLIAALLACCTLIAGCSWLGQPVQPTQSSATSTPTTVVPTSTAPTTLPTTKPQPQTVELTLSFVGDCTLGTNQNHPYENAFHQYYDDNGARYFMENVRHIFAADDLTVVNLEGSLTNVTERVEKKYNHKGPPEYVQILTDGSVEIATLGNNHRLDYGEAGFLETIETLDGAGIDYCYSDVYLIREVKGVKIGFVSVNESNEDSAVEVYLDEGYEVLRQAGCAIVIACVHWGTEKSVTSSSIWVTIWWLAATPMCCRPSSATRAGISATAWAISATAATVIPRIRTAVFSSRSSPWWTAWCRSMTMCSSFPAHFPAVRTGMTVSPDSWMVRSASGSSRR